LEPPKNARMSSGLLADNRTAHEEWIIFGAAEHASGGRILGPLRHRGLVLDRDDLLAGVDERGVSHRLRGSSHPGAARSARRPLRTPRFGGRSETRQCG